jgi:hypothetical protein
MTSNCLLFEIDMARVRVENTVHIPVQSPHCTDIPVQVSPPIFSPLLPAITSSTYFSRISPHLEELLRNECRPLLPATGSNVYYLDGMMNHDAVVIPKFQCPFRLIPVGKRLCYPVTNDSHSLRLSI